MATHGPIKVVVGSGYLFNRKAACALLSSIDGVMVAFEVADPLSELEKIKRTAPDILLWDALYPTDIDIAIRVRKLLSGTKVLVLTGSIDDEIEGWAIKGGVQGCISRECSPELLFRALTAVARGEIWTTHSVASQIISEFTSSRNHPAGNAEANGLSRREWEILAQVAQGHRNRQIAQELFVSESTIKSHLYAVYKKLQISSRLEATLYYYDHQDATPFARLAPGLADPKQRRGGKILRPT